MREINDSRVYFELKISIGSSMIEDSHPSAHNITILYASNIGVHIADVRGTSVTSVELDPLLVLVSQKSGSFSSLLLGLP